MHTSRWQGVDLVDKGPMVSTVGSMSDTGDIQLFIVDAIRLLPVKSHILATKIWCDALPPPRRDRRHPPEPATYRCDNA
jgi:hypothetical protein